MWRLRAYPGRDGIGPAGLFRAGPQPPPTEMGPELILSSTAGKAQCCPASAIDRGRLMAEDYDDIESERTELRSQGRFLIGVGYLTFLHQEVCEPLVKVVRSSALHHGVPPGNVLSDTRVPT